MGKRDPVRVAFLDFFDRNYKTLLPNRFDADKMYKHAWQKVDLRLFGNVYDPEGSHLYTYYFRPMAQWWLRELHGLEPAEGRGSAELASLEKTTDDELFVHLLKDYQALEDFRASVDTGRKLAAYAERKGITVEQAIGQLRHAMAEGQWQAS